MKVMPIIRHIGFILLVPFSFVYFFIILLRNFLYNRGIFKIHKLNAEVISIGNITWGGTGKTPITVFLAEMLARKNIKPCILMRGYGKDEPKLIERLMPGVPLMVGKDRVRNGKKAINEYGVNVMLMDDGFQYRRLYRDLDIVCIDALSPFGNGWMIPAGPMREELFSLKRADVFIITKAELIRDKGVVQNLEGRLRRINPSAVIVKAAYRPVYFYTISGGDKVNIDQFNNKEIVLISGIGSPASFEKMIFNFGLKINKHFIFQDHHWYSKEDLEIIEKYCRKNNIDTIITTEKDAVRLETMEDGRRMTDDKQQTTNSKRPTAIILVLKIKVEIVENEEGLYNRLSRFFNT